MQSENKKTRSEPRHTHTRGALMAVLIMMMSVTMAPGASATNHDIDVGTMDISGPGSGSCFAEVNEGSHTLPNEASWRFFVDYSLDETGSLWDRWYYAWELEWTEWPGATKPSDASDDDLETEDYDESNDFSGREFSQTYIVDQAFPDIGEYKATIYLETKHEEAPVENGAPSEPLEEVCGPNETPSSATATGELSVVRGPAGSSLVTLEALG